MAVRDDFASGEVLTATDLNDTFGDKQQDVLTTKGDLVTFGTAVARLGVGSDDQVLVADSGESLGVKWADVAAGGKILQIVRATDSTNRNTTSTSAVDANISVTITPSLATSAVLLIWTGLVSIQLSSSADARGRFTITDSSNNPISGAELVQIGLDDFSSSGTPIVNPGVIAFAYATPATTSATTYKLRFRTANAATTVQIANATNTGQMYAIEVSA